MPQREAEARACAPATAADAAALHTRPFAHGEGACALHVPGSMYMVMELVDFDLGLLIEHMKQPFSEGQVSQL